jgi:hypothetical protein
MQTFVQMMADRGAQVLKIASRRCVGVLPLKRALIYESAGPPRA